MKENSNFQQHTVRWRRFTAKGYAVFSSLKREVNIGVLALTTLTFANVSTAQSQQPAEQELLKQALEEVEVTASQVPLTVSESARMVTVLSKADIKAAAVHSINDLLKFTSSIDVRQRGEFGVQTDISIRGGTFDQIAILLNGVNLTNPQTGHLTTDFPISIDDIERVEVLSGPAARVYGTSAFNGAINIVTKSNESNNISAEVLGGGYGLVGAGASASYNYKNFNHRISGSFNRSDGATKNSDFQIGKASYIGSYSSNPINLKWLLGFSDQKYGANTFYSAKYDNQNEKNRRYIVNVQGETKGWFKFKPSVYWIRSYDNFQLIRHTTTGENFNLTDVYGANLSANMTTFLGKTAFGVELRNEGILSTNLGKPMSENDEVKIKGKDRYYDKKDNRTNINYYLEHNIILKNLTVSLGVLANMNTALDHKYRFYPGIDISYRPGNNWKLYASWNKALRMPTFTDLYYNSPTQKGNTSLKPERTEAYNVGATWFCGYAQVDLSGFYHRGKDMIDWVMYNADDIYHAANNQSLNNIGIELNSKLDIQSLADKNIWLRSLQVGYSYITQDNKSLTNIYRSNYALNYLRHKLVVKLDHQFIWKPLVFSWSFRWQNRMGDYIDYSNKDIPQGVKKPYPKFALVDLKVSWEKKSYTLYVEANNLLNRTYFDLENVPQPGFWFKGGVKYRFSF